MARIEFLAAFSGLGVPVLALGIGAAATQSLMSSFSREILLSGHGTARGSGFQGFTSFGSLPYIEERKAKNLLLITMHFDSRRKLVGSTRRPDTPCLADGFGRPLRGQQYAGARETHGV